MPKPLSGDRGVLRVVMDEKGFSAYALSRATGVTEKTIHKICRREGPVRMHTIRKLAGALGMDVGELVTILRADGIVVGKEDKP